ncbi:DDE-type integrase/transposase/recombinase [Streptomyces sp. NPDC055085]
MQVGAAWLYLACVIDIRSRRVLGYSMAPHMRAELVIDALQAAVAARGGDITGVIFHADRGSQGASAAFARVCDRSASAGAWAGSARAMTVRMIGCRSGRWPDPSYDWR